VTAGVRALLVERRRLPWRQRSRKRASLTSRNDRWWPSAMNERVGQWPSRGLFLSPQFTEPSNASNRNAFERSQQSGTNGAIAAFGGRSRARLRAIVPHPANEQNAEENVMGSSMKSSRPTPSPVATEPASGRAPQPTTPRELATQAPHVIGYSLQQFVRLAGAQCRMSPAEVAYHNREHDRARRAR
jgi:hypothetical protein